MGAFRVRDIGHELASNFAGLLRESGRPHSPHHTGLRSRDLEQIRPKIRKGIITEPLQTAPPEQGWLDLESIVSVEITSEDNSFPLNLDYCSEIKKAGVRLSRGSQTIRLIFGQPQRLRRIWVVFEETERKRTQGFTVRWAPDLRSSFREIVRQQWISVRRTPRERPRTTLLTFPISHRLI